MRSSKAIILLAVAISVSVVCLTDPPGIVPDAQALYKEIYPELRKELRQPTEPQDVEAGQYPVPFEPLPKTITPCRACHGPEDDFPVNYRRREALLVHTRIDLNHGGLKVWCLDCHHPKKRNYLLPLSDGKLIPFEESYRLCGKCHGTIYRDWRYGIHGLRKGQWNGKKIYLLCVHCHDPHSPKFKPMKPLPPPDKPRTPKPADAEHLEAQR